MQRVGDPAPVLNRGVERHAHRLRPAGMSPLERGDLGPRRRHGRYRDDALAVGELHCSCDGSIRLLRCWRRDHRKDRIHGVVLEHAGELARRVANDGPADDRRRRPGQSCQAECQGVREPHVAVEPLHEDRVIGRDRVDPCLLRQRGPGPAFVIPGSAEDPFARLESGSICLDAPDELCRGCRVTQVDVTELRTTVGEVSVTVGEAGNDQAIACVEHAGVRADQFRYPGAVARRNDRISASSERTDFGIARVASPDRAVHHETGGSSVLARGERSERQCHEESPETGRDAVHRPVRRRNAWSCCRALLPESAGAAGVTAKRSRISSRISSISWSRM